MTRGERIKQVRELRGMTQAELADYTGVENQSIIAHIEGGRYEPSDALIRAIAFRTGFPPAFFSRSPNLDFSLGSLAFRARTKMTATEKVQAYRYAQIAFEIFEELGKRVHQIPVRLSSFHDTPERAAQAMRAVLGVSPDEPVAHVMNILERNGVLILGLPVYIEECDAFSLWAGEGQHRPVIALLAGKPGDRIRYSLLHELRHLSYPPKGSVMEIERDADRFAAEFLLPEKAMRQEIRPPVTLTSIAPLKPRWGASMQALIRRARDLEIVTDRQYHYLMRQMAVNGWRKREPVNLDILIEKPRALRKIMEVLYGIPVDPKKLAGDLNLPPPLVREILEAHAAKPGTNPLDGKSLPKPDKPKGKVLPLRVDGRGRQKTWIPQIHNSN